MKGLIASSEGLFNNCVTANAGALDAALICASLARHRALRSNQT
jgi:hypothetical protein